MKTLHKSNIFSFILITFTLCPLFSSQETNTTSPINSTVNTNNTDQPFNLTYEMEKAFAEHMQNRKEEGNQTEQQTEKSENSEKTVHELIEEIEKEESEKEKEARKEREEWERQIGNFSFSDLITIMVKSHEGETLFENITSVPTTIKLAFMVNHPTKLIDFTISGPLNTGRNGVIRRVQGKNFFFFEHEVESPGLFSFFISNYKYKENAKVSFAISANKKEDKTIETKSFDEMSERLNYVDNRMNELRMKGNLVVRKIEGHNKSATKHNRSMVVLTIIEVIVMVMIFVIQSYYLKKLLNKA